MQPSYPSERIEYFCDWLASSEKGHSMDQFHKNRRRRYIIRPSGKKYQDEQIWKDRLWMRIMVKIKEKTESEQDQQNPKVLW